MLPENIPLQCEIECNGLVPREEYTLSAEDVLSNEAALQSLYKNVTLKKGEMHEVRGRSVNLKLPLAMIQASSDLLTASN